MSVPQTYPPKLALRIFRWYCRPDRLEELEGDLEELFYVRLKSGDPVWRVKFFFWWNVLRCYRSYSKSKTQKNILMTSLFKSYLKLALRHSWKNKWPVTINVLGMGMALSLCVFMYMIYAYNFEFDSIYQDTEDIYRIHSFHSEDGVQLRSEISPSAMEPLMQQDISVISEMSSYFTYSVNVKKAGDYFTEYSGFFSDGFDQMFDLPLKYGSWQDFGDQPGVYLTEELAQKYYGKEYALGKELTIYFSDSSKIDAYVAGVLEKIPLNSSFDFNLLLNRDLYFRGRGLELADWDNKRYTTHFLRLNEADIESVNESLQKYLPLQNKHDETFKLERFELVPFKSSVVSEEFLYYKYANGRLRYAVLLIFTVLISMVFFTACFNLANTSIALVAKRLKEIGIRKTLGSNNKQILFQFLFEMLIICFLAFIIAIATANLTSRTIMGMFSATFLLQDVDLTNVIIFVIIFLGITAVIAGLLPGLYAWRFQPVQIMRKTIKLKGVNWLNKTLIVAQYCFSIAVLVAGITFSQNSSFLDNLDLGYTQEGIFHVPVGQEDYEELRQGVSTIPEIQVAGSKHHFGNFGRYGGSVTANIKAKEETVSYYAVGKNYLSLMEIDILRGRDFLKGSKTDAGSILVNEEFEQRYFPQGAIDQVIKLRDERKTIVGVVENVLDDVYADARIEPIVIEPATSGNYSHLLVKVAPGQIESVGDQLQDIWSSTIDRPYEGQLQADFALGLAGRDTRNLQKIFLGVAVLSIFLSVVGIFSLAKLNVAKRLKEITIRKLLGASLKEILVTINKSFSIILLVSLLLGCGLGYFLADTVLGIIFRYHIDVSIFMSLVSGGVIVLLSVAMISGVSLNATGNNLSGGLREE